MAPNPPDLIRVFDHEPDLLAGLDPGTAQQLQRRLTVRSIGVEPGRWEPGFAAQDCAGHMGLMVVAGFLVRSVLFDGRECAELVGPGDLVRPWEQDDPILAAPVESAWRALQPVTIAVLDARFAAQVARWPSISTHLVGRATLRCRALAQQALIAHVRHADTRILLALWQLADRWGRMTADGVRVPLPLTHQVLGAMTCLQRPTVSAAVRRLREAGAIARDDDGTWLLHGDPPAGEGAGEERSVALA